MIEIRRSEDRGFEDRSWRQSHYTFSFEKYMDPKYNGFHSLRVLNEDILAPGKSYGEATFRDIEILTYVVEGAIEHRDSLGNSTLIREGEVQRLTAGSGITIAKQNLSHHQPTHLFQLWIQPEQHELPPSIEQKIFSNASKWGQWSLMASNNGRLGSVRVHQDFDLYATLLDAGDKLLFDALIDRFYYLQIVSGAFRIRGGEITLKKGDGASFFDETSIDIECLEGGKLLLIDLA